MFKHLNIIKCSHHASVLSMICINFEKARLSTSIIHCFQSSCSKNEESDSACEIALAFIFDTV